MLRQVNIYLISFLACALGINYCLFTWLNFEIIGINSSTLSNAGYLWGIIQTILGVLLIISLLVRNKVVLLWYKYWSIFASIVFVMQLPMASLWYMKLMRDPLAALSGVIAHTLLIVLITLDYLYSHKGTYFEKKENDKYVERD